MRDIVLGDKFIRLWSYYKCTIFKQDSLIWKNFKNYNFADFVNACVESLNSGISVIEMGHTSKINLHHCHDIMHSWFHSGRLEETGPHDLYRFLLVLQPVLQDAIQRKRSTRLFDNNTQLVKGPLTWREYCKDARGKILILEFIVNY